MKISFVDKYILLILNQRLVFEWGGTRSVLILQNDIGNRHGLTTIIVAITSRIYIKHILPTYYMIPSSSGLTHDLIALLEQIRVIDKFVF